MEQKLWLCLDCHAIFYDGENHTCRKVDKSHFISKPGVGHKYAEGIYGSIPQVQCNGFSQIEVPNYPAAFSSSTDVEIQFHAENSQNISNGANSYLQAQRERHRYFPMMNTSKEKNIFDFSLQPSHLSSLGGSYENSEASKCLFGVQSHTSVTRQETTSYSTVPRVSATAGELKNVSSESRITKSGVHNDTSTPILYEQEGLQRFGSSGGESCANTGINIQDLLSNKDSCKPESPESVNERNILRSVNILATNCMSKKFDFVPAPRDGNENQAPHLQSLPQVISRISLTSSGIGGNELLASESIGYHVVGPSKVTDEAYCELQDGRFLCRSCGKISNRKADFVKHYRTHTGERPFACNKCPKRFVQLNHLTKHYLAIHSNEKPYPCDKFEKKIQYESWSGSSFPDSYRRENI